MAAQNGAAQGAVVHTLGVAGPKPQGDIGARVKRDGSGVSFGALVPSGAGNAFVNIAVTNRPALTALRDLLTWYLDSNGQPDAELAYGRSLAQNGHVGHVITPGQSGTATAGRCADCRDGSKPAATKPAAQAQPASGDAQAQIAALLAQMQALQAAQTK